METENGEMWSVLYGLTAIPIAFLEIPRVYAVSSSQQTIIPGRVIPVQSPLRGLQAAIKFPHGG